MLTPQKQTDMSTVKHMEFQLERFIAGVSLKHRTLSRGTVKATQVKWENAREDDSMILWWGQTLLTQIALATAAKKQLHSAFLFFGFVMFGFFLLIAAQLKTFQIFILTPLPSQNRSAVQKTPKFLQQSYSEVAESLPSDVTAQSGIMETDIY